MVAMGGGVSKLISVVHLGLLQLEVWLMRSRIFYFFVALSVQWVVTHCADRSYEEDKKSGRHEPHL
jgi:hypothetical protein